MIEQKFDLCYVEYRNTLLTSWVSNYRRTQANLSIG